MARPRISRLGTWERLEGQVMSVVTCALELLKNTLPEGRDEDTLNRNLHFHLLNAYRQLEVKGIPTFSSAHTYEGNNQPYHGDLLRVRRENKRPDFQWNLIDHSESDPNNSARYYYVECKRLGSPTPSWVFNENYILNGVVRFITEEHAYGKGDKAGMMIGYVQNMNPHEILNEVNNSANNLSIPLLTLSREGWIVGGITRLDHELVRGFAVSPFGLRHLWIDLRP